MPAEATEFQLGYGLMECCIAGSEDGFVDTMPVQPGGQEVVYTYKVNYNSGAYTLSRNVNYPTANYDLLVQGKDSKVVNDQLTIAETLNIEGDWFNRLSGENLTPGNILVSQLSNLPEAQNQGAVKWVALTLVVLIGGFGFGYLWRRKKAQPVRVEDNLDQRKQRLLVELAQLDDSFEDGKIPEEVYRKRRATKKNQLAELIQRSKRK